MLRQLSVVVTASLNLALASGCQRGHVPPADRPVLLFRGTGTSPDDVEAIADILNEKGIRYAPIDTAGLDTMREADLRTHSLLIVPGGNFERLGSALAPATVGRVRDAVANGLNYLGICAGAFFAGNSPYHGLNLTSGVRFRFYSAEERGTRQAAFWVQRAGAPPLELYWEDGPDLAGWGDVAGKYPDGAPAVVEGSFGAGWVVLTGVHPEAPPQWRRRVSFSTEPSASRTYAFALILAALNHQVLQHF